MALVADLRRGVINTIAASHLNPGAIRYRLLRAYGVKLDRFGRAEDRLLS